MNPRINSAMLFALGMGALAGVRSLLAPALASDRLASGEDSGGVRFTPLSAMTRNGTAQLLKVSALGELVVDKLPTTPDRTSPMLLASRLASGGLAGASVAAYRGHPARRGAALGALGAGIASFGMLALRKRLSRRLHLPMQVTGVAEDAFAFTAGSALARRAFDPRQAAS